MPFSTSQFHHFILLKPRASFYLLARNKAELFKKEFVAYIEKSKIKVFSYTTKGFRVDASIMLWTYAADLEIIEEQINGFLKTSLGKHLEVADVYFGKTSPSQYTKGGAAAREIKIGLPRKKYFIVYPFTKSKEWYLLKFERRRKMMNEHIRIGMKYSTVDQLLLYSFGMGSHEFVVSYETDYIEDFQNLVMELRTSKVRLFTLNDTPVTLGIYIGLKKVFDYL